MVYAYTEAGKDHFANAAFGRTSAELETIAVGSGTTDPSVTDDSLKQRVFEASEQTSIVTLEKGDGIGEYVCRISIKGGTEVPGGTDITELGLKTSDGDLVYRETRTAVTVDTGSRIAFEFVVTVTDLQ
jgi:hypothetical protein